MMMAHEDRWGCWRVPMGWMATLMGRHRRVEVVLDSSLLSLEARTLLL